MASVAPIEDFSEEVTELTESEEQAVAEVGGQRGHGYENKYRFR